MAFCCGCEVSPGRPLSEKIFREHFKHTMEVLLLWELIIRQGVDIGDKRSNLSIARINYLEALEAIFPEVKEDNP